MSELIVRRFPSGNHITFPATLRDAIPENCDGRVLLLDSTTAGLSPGRRGKHVSLKLQVKETGKLKGKYTLLMDLHPDAARLLADTLKQLADQAEPVHSRM